jgi:hypothetical protein
MNIEAMYEAIRSGTVTLDEFEEWVYDREYTARLDPEIWYYNDSTES